MKTPKQWVDEYSQSGPFDLVDSCKEATEIVEAIRNEAIEAIHAEIGKYIIPGDLPGNGMDKTAERNGLIMASNIVAHILANAEATGSRP